MNKTSTLATYTLSAGLFAVAGAIAYFTYEVSRIHRDLPDILAQVESTSGKVDPIIAEVREIRRLVPPILTEISAVRGEIPAIVDEIGETRQLIPSILSEVEETRKLIPGILQQVEGSRESIPDILKTVNATSASISQTNKEIAASRQLVPDVLEEVKAIREEIETTRKSIPATLDRVDDLIAKAGVAGQKATEGAVTGVFTGVITAPFRALSGLGNIAGGKEIVLEGEDLRIATEAAVALTAENKGSSKTWANSDSGRRGRLALLDKYDENGNQCVSMQHQAWKNDNKIIDKVFDACRKDDQSPWELKE